MQLNKCAHGCLLGVCNISILHWSIGTLTLDRRSAIIQNIVLHRQSDKPQIHDSFLNPRERKFSIEI